MKEHTISIIGTHKEKLTGREESIIRDKQDIIDFCKQILKEDFGYSLIVAEYPEKQSLFRRLWYNISFWRLQAIVSDVLLVFIVGFTWIYIVPLLELF